LVICVNRSELKIRYGDVVPGALLNVGKSWPEGEPVVQVEFRMNLSASAFPGACPGVSERI
jgi:hypothetical protein